MTAFVQMVRVVPSACLFGLALATAAAAQCPPAEFAKITEPTAFDENFGVGVDFDGSLMIVGAPSANSRLGVAYLFRKEVDPQGVVTWTNEQQVIASDPFVNDNFGTTVSISGQTVGISEQERNPPA